ncbi:MAG: hypothetical protein ACE14V_10885 [bacterium]
MIISLKTDKLNQSIIAQKGEQVMKLVKYLFIISMVVLCFSFSYATKYSTGGGQGTSTVGTTGCDYASLYEASLDFNATANTGNWTLEIATDLSEATSVAFCNTVGTGNTITIKPAAGVQPTVTFLQAGDNTVSAHILVGCLLSGLTTGDGTVQVKKMDGFTIDGSNNGSNSQDLTIRNVLGNTGNLMYARLVYVYGDTDNVTIKNCKFYNYSTYNNYQYCVAFAAVTTYAGNAYVPDNWTVQNCYLQATASLVGEGIGSFGSAPSGTAQTGYTITGNTIYAVRDGIRLLTSGSGTISNNRFRLYGPPGQQGGRAIYHEGANNAANWTIDIYDNNFDNLYTRNYSASAAPSSLSFGLSIIALAGQGTGTCTYNIYNNMMGGFSLLSTSHTAVNENYRGVFVLSSMANVNLFHNSISLPNFNGWAFTPDKCYAFGLGTTNPAVAYTGTFTMKNNIVRTEQVGGSVLYLANNSDVAHVVSDYNDWAIASSDTNAPPVMAYVGGSIYSTFNDWKALSSQDANSQSVDPITTTPDHWSYSTTSTGVIIPPTDLHFSGLNPAPLTPGTPITSPIAITTDFDGDARSLSAPWKGCDEIIAPLDYSPKFIYTQPGGTTVALTVSGGVEPYNWVVNGGVGTLDMSTGSAVTFTPATTAASGDITITDGAAQTAVIPVSVTPTGAPLFNDTLETKEVRFEIFE